MEKSEIMVLIPHYNCPEELVKSILSIKEKIPVDILVVDDGSILKFNQNKIKEKYQFGNVNFIYLEDNKGIGVALNKGIEFILTKRYKYIGRLDAGDFCLENRFSRQINYLQQNPGVALLGTWGNIVNEKRELLYVLKHPISYEKIKKKMYLNNTFIHPSVIFRSDIIKHIGDYPYKYRFAAQDYAFFFNVMNKYQIENLPEVLIDYVISGNSISSRKRKLQVKNRIKIILEHFYFGFHPLYGLLRNGILYMAPRGLTTFLKQIVKK